MKTIDEEMLIAYVVGELDPETHLRIERERQRIGSPVWKWFQEFDAKCADPFNVDWLRLALYPDVEPRGLGQLNESADAHLLNLSMLLNLNPSTAGTTYLASASSGKGKGDLSWLSSGRATSVPRQQSSRFRRYRVAPRDLESNLDAEPSFDTGIRMNLGAENPANVVQPPHDSQQPPPVAEDSAELTNASVPSTEPAKKLPDEAAIADVESVTFRCAGPSRMAIDDRPVLSVHDDAVDVPRSASLNDYPWWHGTNQLFPLVRSRHSEVTRHFECDDDEAMFRCVVFPTAEVPWMVPNTCVQSTYAMDFWFGFLFRVSSILSPRTIMANDLKRAAEEARASVWSLPDAFREILLRDWSAQVPIEMYVSGGIRRFPWKYRPTWFGEWIGIRCFLPVSSTMTFGNVDALIQIASSEHRRATDTMIAKVKSSLGSVASKVQILTDWVEA